MFERFTDQARNVMALAGEEARALRHEYIGTEHILLGVMKQGDGVGATVLKNLANIDYEQVFKEITSLVQRGPDEVAPGKLPPTPRAKNVVEYALEEARAMKEKNIDTEHLLLGLLRETEGIAAQVLIKMGLPIEDVRSEIIKVRGSVDE